ncbi:MAG: hypothetical protein R2827_00175 [Bdellovibrionales bacterium]
MNLTRTLLLVMVAVGISGCSTSNSMKDRSKNLFSEGKAKPNNFWWPDLINLQPLRQHAAESNPYGEDFDYAREFKNS